MKVNEWLAQATKQLEQAGIGSARLDCLILLEDELKKDRAWILANPDFVIQELSLKKLYKQLKQRENHTPLAYIRGKTEFYGREFIINKDVLEPRPESETMIELLRSLAVSKQLTADSSTIVDVGTGSGALAITAKLELPACEVIATDIDPRCLKVAQDNAKKHQVNIKFLRGDLLEPLSANHYQLTAILANLPYVPDSYEINRAALNEPKIAIFGGEDGLDLYRKLFSELKTRKIKPRWVLTESLPPQHLALAKLASGSGFSLEKTENFIQLFKQS